MVDIDQAPGFDGSLPTRTVFGPGAIDQLGKLAADLGARRAFLVTDPEIVAAGHVDRAERSLTDSGLTVRRYDHAPANPTDSDVQACRTVLDDGDTDVLVGLGGGSSIDVAKGCAFLAAGGGTMADYWGVGKATGQLLPLIAVPTTAGTGTEVQSFALIEQDGTHQKMACGDPQAAPRVAILDPELTLSQPRFVTACTGMDALGHALEAAVTTARNQASQRCAAIAFGLLQAHLPRVLAQPDDLNARGQMLLGASLAGAAIEHSMLGAAHALANPLTAQFDLAHGQAVALMLPGVLRCNAEDAAAAGIYAALARDAGLCRGDAPRAEAIAALAERLESLLAAASFERPLSAYGVAATDLPRLAEEAARQWTARFNPRPVDAALLHRLLDDAL